MGFQATIISNNAKDPKSLFAAMESYLKHEGFTISSFIEADHARLESELRAIPREVSLVIVSGGTFVGAKENSPEVLAAWSDCHIPGFGELMRFETVQDGFTTYMQRSGAWTKGSVLAIAVPASTKAALDHLKVLGPLILKTVRAMAGESQESNSNVIEVSQTLN